MSELATRAASLVGMETNELPEGVGRDRYCTGPVDLETCHALSIELTDGRQWIVWRDRSSKRLRPIGVKRWRDVRPGCKVIIDDKVEAKVVAVNVYR